MYTDFVMVDSALSNLMIKGQAGDALAYEQCLCEASHILKRLIKKKVTNPNDQDDVLQIILIAIHKASHTYQKDRSFLTWMYAIANYKITDYYRHYYKHQKTDYVDVLDNQVATVSHEAMVETKYDLKKIFHSLTSFQQDLLRLKKIEGYSIKALATRFKKTPASIKVTIHRSIEKLKQQVEKSYEK